MVILLLLVTMVEMKGACMPTSKDAPIVRSTIICMPNVPCDVLVPVASMPGKLKRSVGMKNLPAYESLSPKEPPKYLSKRPTPIDAWTDYHLDRYYNNWGPREYFLYAMKLWREKVHNTYNDIHLEIEDLYG